MTTLYQIPKVRIPIEARFLNEAPMELEMFVGQGGGHHGGYERPSEVLNGTQVFIPMVRPGGEPVIVHRDALLMVSFEAIHEETLADGGSFGHVMGADITVDLEGGTSALGRLEYMMPGDRCRVQDYLNTNLRFLPLREGPLMRLIHARFIRRVTLRSPESVR
jgi:hypothetical protein